MSGTVVELSERRRRHIPAEMITLPLAEFLAQMSDAYARGQASSVQIALDMIAESNHRTRVAS
jgi:hypothetical protein